MREIMLSIFTPTFNRAYILERLYKSLLRQTCQEFKWIIVDDGSEDNTESLVATWLGEKRIEIQYFKQENGGKQRAHNLGVEKCETHLFLCIDSDDYMTDNSVELILRMWKEECNNIQVAGVVALKGKDAIIPLGTDFPDGIRYSRLDELYEKHRFRGDTAIAYRTEILKRYPFWVAKGEKFIGEGYVYQQIDQKYTLAILPEIIMICEYLDDGYSKNVRKLTKANPISYAVLKRQTICYSDSLVQKYYQTILCIVGCLMAQMEKPLDFVPNKILGFLAYIPAMIVWVIFYKDI